MENNYVVGIITVFVTLIAGELTKQYPNIDKKRIIPIQNVAIGVIIAIFNWIVTKDFNIAIASSGLFAGGVYDLVHNLKLWKGEEE